MLSIPFSMHVFRFRFIDIHVFTWFQIYCRSFNFLFVTCHCMYLYAWTTSLDHVHMWLPEHANWLYHMYSSGCFLTTLNPHVQIPESGPWQSCCSWSEHAQRKRGLAVSCSDPLSSSLLLIGSRDSHLATREYLPVFYIVHLAFALLGDFIFLRYCIMLCDNCVLVLLLLECILPLCFRTLILACTDA